MASNTPHDLSNLQWSYGVLLWEIYTFGEIPDTEISDLALLCHLKAKHHLKKPPALTNDYLYKSFLSCKAINLFHAFSTDSKNKN